MTTLTCVKTRETISLTNKLAASGEGSVWVTDQSSKLAKLYHQVTPERLEKLETMLVYPPVDPKLAPNHITYAWPESLLRNKQGKIVGFLMPRIVGASELIQVYTPLKRKELKLAIDWHYLHVVAYNLALAVHNLHEEGYVLGDIKAQNILVNSRGLVSIIDTDSFQVRHPLTGKLHYCLVGSPDYTPPDLLGKDFSQTEQNRSHDRFRIAVIFYQLLFGVHPFTDGRWLGGGDPPELRYCLEQGLWPFGWDANLDPGRYTIPLNVLHPSLKACFLECFNEGHFDPSQRPTAERWQAAFNQARQDLVICRSVESHVYSQHYGHCYWCDRSKQLGTDIFAWAPGLKRKKLPNLSPLATTITPPKAPSAATPPISPTVNPLPRRSFPRVWILVGIISIVVLRASWWRGGEPTSSVTQIVQENEELPSPTELPITDLSREIITPTTPRASSTPSLLVLPGSQGDDSVREKPTPITSQTTSSLTATHESEAINLVKTLYSRLSEKEFSLTTELYNPNLSQKFDPEFFEKFDHVTVENLYITSRTNESINLQGDTLYVWPNGATQRESRSYTVRLVNQSLKLTDSKFIKVIRVTTPTPTPTAYSQSRNCILLDQTNESRSSSLRVVSLEQFGIQVSIPENYRTMLHQDGSVEILSPRDFAMTQCIAQGGRGGRGYYSESIEFVKQDPSLSLREQASLSAGVAAQVIEYNQFPFFGYIVTSGRRSSVTFIGHIVGKTEILKVRAGCDCPVEVEDITTLLSRIQPLN